MNQTLAERRDAKRFYAGSAWRRFRLAYLQAHPMCVDCEASGRATFAEEVHHKQQRVVRPDLAYSQDNCESLCKSCHSYRTRGEQQEGVARYVVWGEPGSGKSSWVAARRKPGDLVWDWDDVAECLFRLPKNYSAKRLYGPLDAIRQALLRYLRYHPTDRRVFVIVTREQAATAIGRQIDAELVGLEERRQ